MKYEITIKLIEPVEGKDYPTATEVYTQTVEDLDVQAVVAVVNGLTK